MLVLTRKPGESIVIPTSDGMIEITLLEINRGKIRLGFVAPKQLVIDRLEVYTSKIMGEKPNDSNVASPKNSETDAE